MLCSSYKGTPENTLIVPPKTFCLSYLEGSQKGTQLLHITNDLIVPPKMLCLSDLEGAQKEIQLLHITNEMG